MAKFDMFRYIYTQQTLNVKKQYVTGCEHFWDPVPEMHINSFARA